MKGILFLFFISVAVISKGQIIIEDSIKGFVMMEDGKGESVKVEYRTNPVYGLDSSSLDFLLRRVRLEAIKKCSNMVSFRPYKKSLIIIGINKKTGDYNIMLNFLAQNAYGAENEISVLCYFDRKTLKFIKAG